MVEKLYDEFFGAGYWEKQYKQHIVIFAKKCIAEAQKTAHNSDYTECPICGGKNGSHELDCNHPSCKNT